jgi:uncharacterized protein (DUF433 family)
MVKRSYSTDQYIRGMDYRQMPRYSLGEAARYLGLPESTMRAWFEGMTWGSKPNLHYYRPILVPASPHLLSFFDIASAHILMAFKKNEIRPEQIRIIVQSLEAEYPKDRYPLLGRNFYMFGRNLVIKQAGKRLNLSRSRQLGLRAVMDQFLARLELDESKMPIRFSPILDHVRGGRTFIVIDPGLSVGRPVIKGTGIAAEVISKRNASGESIATLVKDYRLSRRAIEEAIKYFPAQAA